MTFDRKKITFYYTTPERVDFRNLLKDMPPIGSGVMTPDGLGKVCALHFLNGSVQVKLEDGKIKDYVKSDIEMIDGDVNVDIDVPNLNYQEDDENINISSLEDDKNSSTGNI